MKLQDLNLYQVKEASEKVYKEPNTCWQEIRMIIPEIFFKLSEKKKTLKTGESDIDGQAEYLKSKHSCTIKGIQALSKLAEKGDTGAMRVLCDYFEQKGEDVINEWTYKRNLQAVADRVVEKEREKEREKKERERKKQAQLKKSGCIMPKGLMK